MRILGTSGTKVGCKTLKSSASVLGLVAGAIGWSGLANAASDESGPQTLLLPDHYRLIDDGVLVFKLEGGEELSLNPGQYVILQDGLLLITDELAQVSMQSLPVMGSIRAQLTSELQPVRSPDGSVVQASDASPLWSGDGPAPRLFEEVDIQRYELAQNSSETQTQSEANLGQATGAAVGGLSLAGLSLLSSIPGTEPEQATEEEESAAPAPPPGPEFLSNTMFQPLQYGSAKAFTGSAGDSYIGYSSASTLTPEALDLNYPELDITFDMSAGGNNHLLAGNFVGARSGNFSYTGGSGSDVLTFGIELAVFSGNVTLNLGSDTAADTVTFQGSIGASGGSVTIKNFNYNHDTIDVAASVSAIAGEIVDAGGNLTWTDSGNNHTITFVGIGTGGTGVQATTAQLIADII